MLNSTKIKVSIICSLFVCVSVTGAAYATWHFSGGVDDQCIVNDAEITQKWLFGITVDSNGNITVDDAGGNYEEGYITYGDGSTEQEGLKGGSITTDLYSTEDGNLGVENYHPTGIASNLILFS